MPTLNVDWNEISAPSPFLASSGSHEYGSYHYQNMVLQLHGEQGLLEFLSTVEEQFRHANTIEEELDIALRHLTLLHEVRHFHDCFGTLAGISLFGAYLRTMGAFCDTAKHLYENRLSWSLPLADWARDESCPEVVAEFVHAYERLQAHSKVFLGDLQLPMSDEPIVEPWVDVEIGDLETTFPASLHRLGIVEVDVDDPSSAEAEPKKLGVHPEPLGFEVLIEGNAQALQRSIARALYPSIADKLWDRLNLLIHMLPIAADPAQTGMRRVLPYNIVDAFVTRYLKKRASVTQFHGGLILDVIDGALMNSVAPPFDKPTKSKHPGYALVEALDEMVIDRKGDVAEIKVRRDHPSALDGLIQRYEKTESPEKLESGQGYIHPLNYIEAYAIHKITLPLMKARRRQGNKLYTNVETYLENIFGLPTPPVIVNPRSLMLAKNNRDIFLKKWSEFVILGALMEQVMHNSVLSCPRWLKSVPGIEFMELRAEPSCSQYIRRRGCQTWSRGRLQSLPKCPFSTLVRLLGFER